MFGELVHVVLHRIVHFLHQPVNFLLIGTVADRLGQLVLRPLQPGLGIGQIALLDLQGNLPQDSGNFVAKFRGQPVLNPGIQPFHRHPQHQIGLLIADKALGQMRDGPENLRGARAVIARPQEIAAHFHQTGRKRIEEPPTRQHDGHGFRMPDLPVGVLGKQGDRDRQVGKGVLRKVFDQRLFELRMTARNRHRQVDHQHLARFRRCGQTIMAIHPGQVEADLGAPGHHREIIRGAEWLGHAAIGLVA